MKLVKEKRNVLNKEECDIIINYCNNRLLSEEDIYNYNDTLFGDNKYGEINKDLYKKIKSGMKIKTSGRLQSYFHPTDGNLKVIKDKLKLVISELVTETSDEFYSTDNIEPFIFFKYPKRSRCALHSDVIPQEKDENGNILNINRTWSCIVYLNDDFEGGETNFPILGKTIVPETGKIIIYKTDEETIHEGTKILKGKKFIMVCGIKNRSIISG